MTFVNSWAVVVGLVAAGLPVLVHRLTRPRPVVLPLSTVRFVAQAVRQKRAWYRLRDVLILAVRTAAVVLLAGAVARPLFGRRALAPEDSTAGTTRVVVLDVSQSMAAQAGGLRAIDRARPMAATHLEFRPGLAAGLVLAGASARAVFDRPTVNFRALRDELAGAAPRPERLDVAAALDSAAHLLAADGGRAGRRRELVILSDFQRTQWAGADFSALPRDVVVHLEYAGAPETPPNLAVLHVGSAGRAELGRPLTVEVGVGNFSAAARSVEVGLTLGDATYRLEGLCAAGTKTTLSAEVVPRAAGWHAGEARLGAGTDALTDDDARAFVVDVRPPPVFALVTRQAADVRPSSSYYLERALVPTEARDDRPAPRVVRLGPDGAEGEALASADMAVVDHAGRIPDELLARLVGMLRRGRGVLYVASDPADAANLKRLADMAGTDLRLPVEFVPPPPGAGHGPRFLAGFRRDAPPFRTFGDRADAALAPLRLGGGLVSRPVPQALADDVRASFGDRSAFLVVSACGAGMLAILNADLGSSNLPASPTFVPLVGEVSALLLGNRGSAEPLACGEPFALALPPDAGSLSGLALVPPGRGIELADEHDGLVVRTSAAGPPGVSRVVRGARTVFALATAVPESESDLRPLPRAVLEGRLAGGRTVLYRDANRRGDEVDTLWTWLAVACAVCLAAEPILLGAFRT